MIVTEKMLCDMDTLIHTPQRVPPQLRGIPVTYLLKLKMMHDAALGVCWLHDILKMVHRDLKPANFLVCSFIHLLSTFLYSYFLFLKLDENFRVKICDFGFTEHFKAARQVKMKGTGSFY
jgi:serine/threonine protein kinase